MSRPRLAVLAGLVLAAAPVTVRAQTASLNCRDDDRDRDGVRVCEIREVTLDSRAQVNVDATPNGGITVRAWDRDQIRLRARVEARARSSGRAEELIGEVEIETGGTVRADGPRTGRREWWSVSYELFVPRNTDLDLRSMNGGIGIEGVHGRMSLETMNGGLALDGAGGDVSGRTTNGGVDVTLTGATWDGEGLDLETTNGGVSLSIPEDYAARLETSTVNGGITADFPVTVRGRISRSLTIDLGSGGRTIRARTTNGGVVLRRP
jgi:hypothetical protein